MIKEILKNTYFKFAAIFGRHTKNHSTPQLLILMYHRILPLDSSEAKQEEPGMVVSPELFAEHLEYLKANFELTTISDWLDRKNSDQPLPRKACAITFDDGWLDNYQYAFPILKQEQVPATIFLVTDMIGSNQKFWPERLSTLLSLLSKLDNVNLQAKELRWLLELAPNLKSELSHLDNEIISQIIQKAKRHTDIQIHKVLDESFSHLKTSESSSPSLMSWEQVFEMDESGLVDFGSHTCNHIRLNESTSLEQVNDEVGRSKYMLQDKLKRPINIFCYPNGDYSEASYNKVKEEYQLAVTTASGWNDSKSDLIKLKRISIHQGNSNTQTKFLAQISGWL